MAINVSTGGYSEVPKRYTCSCGSIHEVWSTRRPERESGEILCDVCDEPIHRWDGSRTWHSTLIEGRCPACKSILQLEPQPPGTPHWAPPYSSADCQNSVCPMFRRNFLESWQPETSA